MSSGRSLVTITRLAPLAITSLTIEASGTSPWMAWPPVIEVCALRRILKVMLTPVLAQ